MTAGSTIYIDIDIDFLPVIKAARTHEDIHEQNTLDLVMLLIRSRLAISRAVSAGVVLLCALEMGA